MVQVGALVSRALAVWVATYSVYYFAYGIEMFVTGTGPSYWFDIVASASLMALAVFLWFGARLFGSVQGLGADPDQDHEVPSKAGLASGLVQAVCLYWLVVATAGWVDRILRHYGDDVGRPLAERLFTIPSFVSITFWVLALFGLIHARRLGRLL